jgi:hypothetical protein
MKSLTPELTEARLACGEAQAFIPRCAVEKDLDDKNLGRPSHRLGRQFRICELRILATEVFFDHPTGSRTGLSHEDRNLKVYDFSERLTERRPSNWGNTVGNSGAHEHSCIAR